MSLPNMLTATADQVDQQQGGEKTPAGSTMRNTMQGPPGLPAARVRADGGLAELMLREDSLENLPFFVDIPDVPPPRALDEDGRPIPRTRLQPRSAHLRRRPRLDVAVRQVSALLLDSFEEEEEARNLVLSSLPHIDMATASFTPPRLPALPRPPSATPKFRLQKRPQTYPTENQSLRSELMLTGILAADATSQAHRLRAFQLQRQQRTTTNRETQEHSIPPGLFLPAIL